MENFANEDNINSEEELPQSDFDEENNYLKENMDEDENNDSIDEK